MSNITEFLPESRYPTPDEPIPSVVGTPGWMLLLSGTADRLARTVTAVERAELVETCRLVLSAMRPATAAEIAMEIEALALHFPVLRYNEAEHRTVNRDWLDDLSGWPVDLIREARRQWRNSEKDRFPTPGQLKKQVEPIFSYRKTIARRAEEFLRLSQVKEGDREGY